MKDFKNQILEKRTAIQDLIDNVDKVFIGKKEVITNAVLTLLADGHLLLEDVPGVGKTLLAKALAASISGDLKRVQFTADLLPSDIIGVTVYRQNEGVFEFKKGPVFTNILLGDEINRATPRTQSSLLEVMEEKQVTVDGEVHYVSRPFFVIATQNPIELEGTYPLPFSQMDRFMSRIRVGYLDADFEINMLKGQRIAEPLTGIKSVLSLDEIDEIQILIRGINIVDELLEYIVNIINRTRNTNGIEYGVSPRGSLDLMRLSQSRAFLDGRDYVIPDDIKQSAALVLSHRIIQKKGTRLSVSENEDIVNEIVESTHIPI